MARGAWPGGVARSLSSQVGRRVVLRDELGAVLGPFRDARQQGAELAFQQLARLRQRRQNDRWMDGSDRYATVIDTMHKVLCLIWMLRAGLAEGLACGGFSKRLSNNSIPFKAKTRGVVTSSTLTLRLARVLNLRKRPQSRKSGGGSIAERYALPACFASGSAGPAPWRCCRNSRRAPAGRRGRPTRAGGWRIPVRRQTIQFLFPFHSAGVVTPNGSSEVNPFALQEG